MRHIRGTRGGDGGRGGGGWYRGNRGREECIAVSMLTTDGDSSAAIAAAVFFAISA